MQPFKVEIIQNNYTTSQNTKQHELYHSHCHSLKTHAHAYAHSKYYYYYYY